MNMISETKLDLLVFGAHPDDAEIGMGGTIAKHVAAGLIVGICDLTRAELSSNGTPELREREAAQAARILGIHTRCNLALPDREFTHPAAGAIPELVRVIRQYRPRIVFAPYWIDRHPDHVACSHLVEEAVFNAKLLKYTPELSPHQVERTFYYFIHETPKPDIVVDITPFHAQKMEALQAYRSQFQRIDGSVETPLNSGYLEQVEARDRLLGLKHRTEYAEGFASKSPLLLETLIF